MTYVRLSQVVDFTGFLVVDLKYDICIMISVDLLTTEVIYV